MVLQFPKVRAEQLQNAVELVLWGLDCWGVSLCKGRKSCSISESNNSGNGCDCLNAQHFQTLSLARSYRYFICLSKRRTETKVQPLCRRTKGSNVRHRGNQVQLFHHRLSIISFSNGTVVFCAKPEIVLVKFWKFHFQAGVPSKHKTRTGQMFQIFSSEGGGVWCCQRYQSNIFNQNPTLFGIILTFSFWEGGSSDNSLHF